MRSRAGSTWTFSFTGSLEGVRVGANAVLLDDGKVLIAGGTDDGAHSYLNTAELYDPGTGRFQATGDMTVPRSVAGATRMAGGRVLVVGGEDLTDDRSDVQALRTAETYDPKSGKFSPTGEMGDYREWPTATLLANGKVLVTAGGTASSELYWPDSPSASKS